MECSGARGRHSLIQPQTNTEWTAKQRRRRRSRIRISAYRFVRGPTIVFSWSSLSSSQSGNWHVYSKRKERRNVRCEQDGQTDGHGVHRERERYRYVRRTNWTVDSLLVGLGLLAWCSHPRHRKCPIAKVNPLTNSDRWCSGCCSAGGGVYG